MTDDETSRAARLMGKRGKGIPKTLSAQQRAKKADVARENIRNRWPDIRKRWKAAERLARIAGQVSIKAQKVSDRAKRRAIKAEMKAATLKAKLPQENK